MLSPKILFALSVLSLCPIACGGESEDGSNGDGNGSSSGNESGTSQSTLDACEEACLERDACDDTISYSPGYCESECDSRSAAVTGAGCGAEFRALSVCQASGNDCPLPGCLAETREFEDCLSGSNSAEALCMVACEENEMCEGDDAESCEEACMASFRDSEDAGCAVEHTAALVCIDPCADDAFLACEDQLVELSQCVAE